MPFNSKIQVALEFGFSIDSINRALRTNKAFKTAGELVTYLNEMELSDDEIEPKCANKTEQDINDNPLMKETMTLYATRYCLKCFINPRCFVLLPCSHLTLCDKCFYEGIHCPIKSCAVKCEMGIHTYIT